MLNDDAGYSWNAEAFSHPGFHGYPTHPYFSTNMHHDHLRRSDRYRRGISSSQSSFYVTRNLPSNEEAERLHSPSPYIMMMSRDQHYAGQDFRTFESNEPSPSESAVLALQDFRRERNEDPSFLPPRIGEAQSFTLEASFSSVGDNQDDHGMEPTAKRARRDFQDHDSDHGSHEGSHPFLDPYAHFNNGQGAFLESEYAVQQPWLHQSGDEAYSPYIHFRLGDSFPTEGTPADQLPITTNPTHRRTDSTNDDAAREDDEDDRKPAAAREDDEDDAGREDDEEDHKPAAAAEDEEAESKQAAAENDDGKPTTLGATADAVECAVMSFETGGGERTSESQLKPGPSELEDCKTTRAQDALKMWYQRLSELVEFKQVHGHTNVPQKYDSNASLGIWVNKQRCYRDSLTPEKCAALETVRFDWGKRKGQHAWNEKFSELIAYKAEHGDCLVPTKCQSNPTLGRWVSTQRSQYKNFGAGKRSSMSVCKIQRLEGIGFIWSMVDP